jgi:MFS transporter, CP family, cyanate transporter
VEACPNGTRKDYPPLCPGGAHAWFISVFFGSQSPLYLFLLTSLPPLYVDRGLSPDSAGLLLSVLNLVQIPASIGIPALADRTHGRPLAVAGGDHLARHRRVPAISVFPLLAPWVWVLLLGIGLGGLFALSLTLPADNAPDADEAGRLAATTFCTGYRYILSSLGPFAVGALRQVT